MPVFAVEYTYDERADERAAIRTEHRAFLRDLNADGALLASGPYGAAEGHPDGALLLVRAPSAAAAVAVLDDDPFHGAGLICERSAREWDPVIGPWAG